MKRVRQTMYDDGLDPKKFKVEYRKRKKASKIKPLVKNE